MANYHENLKEEEAYLEKTTALIRKELELEKENLWSRKYGLVNARKEMWEESVHFSNDFEKMADVNQQLAEVANQTGTYRNTRQRADKYERMLGSPYFGRFDFVETDSADTEKIYVGLYNVMDSKTHAIMVYDWRSPISSLFYRYEPGKAAYKAPFGEIKGEILLKRQYKIQNSQLKYFFDCSVRIGDEILQEVLSRNSSVKMRNIIETIQKEQDIIIRDTENELLIVQGVAGSGKTSIALHRVAFLLYEGLGSKLSSNNILILSPNTLFTKYISSVLPELGEENVAETTVEEIFNACFGDRVRAEGRNMQLESLTCSKDPLESNFRRQCIQFKGSRTFKTILDRFLQHYERRLLPFEDIYYDGSILESKQQLRSAFLDNKIGMPMAKRLKRMESQIIEKVHPLQKKRLEKIKEIVRKKPEHQFEIKPYSRLLSIKEARTFSERLRRFTEVDCLHLLKMLFKKQDLFHRLAKGLALPENIDRILSDTLECLDKKLLLYEDALALLYLKLRVEGSDMFSEIRQVVIDEAQDYYPLHYEVFKLLFPDARFTVMGDVSQAIEKKADYSLYEEVAQILGKRKTVKLFLTKSYRASYEINTFAQKLMEGQQEFLSFERHETEPMVIYQPTGELLEETLLLDIKNHLNQGFESIAVLCKTQQQAAELHSRLKSRIDMKLLSGQNSEVEKGVMVLPVYMAKGLEFDVALVYGVSDGSYSTDFDRKLLYVACTRALHRLGLYYTGEKSALI